MPLFPDKPAVSSTPLLERFLERAGDMFSVHDPMVRAMFRFHLRWQGARTDASKRWLRQRIRRKASR